MNLEESIDKVIASLVQLIRTKYISSGSEYRPVDFARKAQYLTLDLIGQIAFGKPFGFIENDDDMYAYIETTENTIPVMMFVCAFPALAKVIHSPIFKSLMPKKTDSYGLGKIMG